MDVRGVRYQISFTEGPDLLPGDLVLPSGPGPHPAVALVGGISGPRDRGRWVEDLVGHGLAVLTWDSPGWGASPGRARWQAPDERTLEVLAAVDLLATLADVSPHGIAVVGSDSGAWAAGLAAALGSRVRAAVLIAPPCTGTFTQELHRCGQRLSGRGFIGAEVGLAQLVLGERIRRLAAGEPAASVLRAEAPCRHAPWYPGLPGSTVGELEAFATLGRYHPAAVLASVQCPVLGVFGADDAATAPLAAAHALRETLSRNGGDHLVTVVPRSDPAFAVPGSPGWSGPRVPGDPHPELVARIAGWLAPRLSGHHRAPGDPSPSGAVAQSQEAGHLIPRPRAG